MSRQHTRQSWKITYPEGGIRYIEAFRRDLWDYSGVADVLKEAFARLGGVRTVVELGSGAGTNLLELHHRGFSCTGYDVNRESVDLARVRAEERGVKINFHHLDFMNELPSQRFDAVLSLFVPISKVDMADLMQRARGMLPTGGYFACMLLFADSEKGRPVNNKIHTAEQLDLDGACVVRQNFYTLNGAQLDFKGVYFVTLPDESVRSFFDIDTYDLMSEDEMLPYDKSCFEHVERIRIHGKPDQCPPMTYEAVDIFRAV